MRRLVVALVVAAVSLSLAGCGGGGGEATPPAATTPPPAPPAPAAAAVDPATMDKSPVLGEMFVAFPEGEDMPEAVTKRLESQQAMLILFYDSEQDTTDEVQKEAKAAVERNRGMIDLISYDLAKYRSDESTSLADIDPKIQEDEVAKAAAELSRALEVDLTPYIVIVDQQGFVIFKWRGPIDRDLLDRQVQRVG